MDDSLEVSCGGLAAVQGRADVAVIATIAMPCGDAESIQLVFAEETVT